MDSKKNNLNLTIIFISTILIGYFFSQVHAFEQRAVDAGLVLANLVNYPDQISPMKEYFFKSWTSLHQLCKFLFNLDWSISSVSKFLIFLTAVLYFLGIFLTIHSATKSIFLSIFVAFIILIFQKNLGDTDYPSLVFSEHTYGMMSLAMVTFIFGLFLSGNLFFAGFFSSILISVHPLIGIWVAGIVLISLIADKYYFQSIENKKKIIKGFSLGLIFTATSLIYFFILSADLHSGFDSESYSNYMKYWEGHRNENEIHFEYLSKTLLLLIFVTTSLFIFRKNFSKNFIFGLLCILVSIILSTIIYFIYKFLNPNIPNLLIRLMPARFTILHSIIGWPIILSTLYVIIKKFEYQFIKINNFSYILILFLVIYYSVSHYKVFIKLQNLFVKNTFEEVLLTEDKKFWDEIKKENFNGYIVTTFSSSTISMRKTLKPIILDVSSLDFVPYFPNTAKSMSLIIEQIYGISFQNPPDNMKNKPYLSDESIKNNFENYSEKKWKEISNKFNFHGIILPINWKISLKPAAKGSIFAFYKI